MIDYHMHINGNYITVDRTQVDLYEVTAWAKKNCPHYVTNQYHGNYHGNDLIDFFFVDSANAQKEIMWFKLKWA